ncbi:MAG: MBL fold metallo-hydrolase [Treponema sp.]|nr:MBL fold metallo-hydrolase [Treponema sp.]
MKRTMLMGLIFGAMAVGGYTDESDGIFAYKAGQFEIYMLNESERDGNTSILVSADAALIRRYIPASGFKHATNAFLIKAPSRNILIDNGTGSSGIILDKIRKLGVEPENIDTILLTHLHGDHFGSLQRDGRAVFPKATVYLSDREYEYFTKTNVNQGAVNALAPYGSQVKTFTPGALNSRLTEIIPGISPIAAYGHTPGHTAYLIENGGEKFIIAGDILHIALVQFPAPNISATYDMDASMAAAMRARLLDYAAMNKIPLGGMHIAYPGAGMVEPEGSGFKFIPLNQK